VTATLAFSASALAAVSLQQISSDPFTNITAQHKTQVEPDTFAWGSTWIATFQSGRIFGGGASNIGFAVSHDGGATFTQGFLPGTTFFASPAGTYPAVSDPSVAYDARHGVWLISYLGLFPHDSPTVNVLVSRSTDGGNTWSNPVPVATTDAFFDKNWTTCDNTPTSPFYGHCYTEFDNASAFDLELLSTSTDGGLTWGAPVATPDHVHGLGGQPVVQPDGRVIVPFEGFNDFNVFVKSFSSNDGGATLTKSVTVATQFIHPPAGDLRAPALPSARIDAAGKVYVVWADCRFEAECATAFGPSSANDLVLSTSTNGETWTAPARIPLDPVGSGVDHFLPGLGIDPATSGSSARLALVYYYYPVAACHTSTCQLDVGSSESRDGGATWTAGSLLAGPMHLTWLPLTSQGYMVGDYFSTSFVGGAAYPAFALAAPPSSGGSSCVTATPHCDQGTFTVAGGLTAGAQTFPVTPAAAARTASVARRHGHRTRVRVLRPTAR
jgi:hypothetical protein